MASKVEQKRKAQRMARTICALSSEASCLRDMARELDCERCAKKLQAHAKRKQQRMRELHNAISKCGYVVNVLGGRSAIGWDAGGAHAYCGVSKVV